MNILVLKLKSFILSWTDEIMTMTEPVNSLSNEVESAGKEGGEMQPLITPVEQDQTDVDNEDAFEEADANEAIEDAATSLRVDNAIADASIENEGKYTM